MFATNEADDADSMGKWGGMRKRGAITAVSGQAAERAQRGPGSSSSFAARQRNNSLYFRVIFALASQQPASAAGQSSSLLGPGAFSYSWPPPRRAPAGNPRCLRTLLDRIAAEPRDPAPCRGPSHGAPPPHRGAPRRLSRAGMVYRGAQTAAPQWLSEGDSRGQCSSHADSSMLSATAATA